MTHSGGDPADGPDPPGLRRVTPAAAAPRTLCTDCGLSRTENAKSCGRACQFIRPDYPTLETHVHGRARGAGDELFFGPFLEMRRARLTPSAPGAQWSGITTELAATLLREGAVDAVLAMAPARGERWRPEPVIITDAAAMAACRGMRMGYAPLLSLMAPARAAGHRKIAVVAIPCQTYALRALEAEWGFDEISIIGTPCSDNTTTENFLGFLGRLTDRPETVTYLEFRADYRVEIRFEGGRVEEIPFLSLPLSDLPQDFWPLTCRTCVDYTNALADITVGYMGGEGDQWLIVRNTRGRAILERLEERLESRPLRSRGDRTAAVQGFVANTRAAAGGLPLRRMPRWLRPIVSWAQPRFGPRGLEFARARLEMKAAETILHLRRAAPKRMKWMIPPHVWRLAEPYGVVPEATERPAQPGE
ncbi:MAG: Coenzyme F420 hydrogenase/dehydrogenase, beta subunit C-terminal domain [Pseudomonadota bacterium]